MSRPDLAFLRDAIGLGSILDAVVTKTYPNRGLIELAFDGGVLLAPTRGIPAGTSVRVRIPARDVILATSVPAGLSLHNVLAGTVSAVRIEPSLDVAVVQLAVGRILLLAEVTRDAIERLGISVGVRLQALVKSVALDVQGHTADEARDVPG